MQTIQLILVTGPILKKQGVEHDKLKQQKTLNTLLVRRPELVLIALETLAILHG
jgi:hypothetical protein